MKEIKNKLKQRLHSFIKYIKNAQLYLNMLNLLFLDFYSHIYILLDQKCGRKNKWRVKEFIQSVVRLSEYLDKSMKFQMKQILFGEMI